MNSSIDLPSSTEDNNELHKQSLQDWLIQYRLPILVGMHIALFSLIYWCAFLMRFTLDIPDRYLVLMAKGLPIIVAVKLLAFWSLRSFHGWWRHVHFSDVVSLVKSSVVASLSIIAVDYFFLHGQIPRIVVVNDLVLTIVVVGGLRSTWRVWDERIAPLDSSRIQERAFLLGNENDSAQLAHLINGQQGIGIRVLGLISPASIPQGRRYFGDLRVFGGMLNMPRIMQQHRAQTLFVVAGTVPARQLRDMLDKASDKGFKIKILPKLREQLRGLDQLPIREVSYNDLLKRKPVSLDLGSIERVVESKTVLVTGAGGSIGSELCRQLSRFQPGRLILLGRGENRIYEIERELRGRSETIEMIPKIANITDQDRMREIFETYRPDLVFHAAAHKHVPLVEQNVGESIINNVLGTKVVADLADQFSVQRFILVSSDKAVNPTSVMGCTKQMAERYCQALGGKSETKFISTRFGNVLGSAGSVVPLFQKQIRDGGPITITDFRMKRYFMTIPEASQLVIQAASMGNGGEIFVLEMGQPVKILDLAHDLIRLAGHSPGSIDVVETGMRQGEKLFEELYYDSEKSLPTKHDQILSSYSRLFSMEEVEKQVFQLIDLAYKNPGQIRVKLNEFIPEFHDQKLDHIHNLAGTVGELEEKVAD